MRVAIVPFESWNPDACVLHDQRAVTNDVLNQNFGCRRCLRVAF